MLQDKGDKTPAPGIGAAVHIPAAVDNPNLTVYIDCAYRNDPTIQSCVNTINRAELVAIRQAMLHHPPDSPMTIYTDSLCSLHLLNRLIYEPRYLVNNLTN
mgnify:CR=1 FL=1